MKNIKTKPKIIKHSPSPVKDMKAIMKNQYIRQKAAVKTQTNNFPHQEQKPENYATDTVENTVYGLSDTVYRQSKSYVQDKIKKHKPENIKEKETPNIPKQNTPALPHSKKNAVLKRNKSTLELKHSAKKSISKVKNMAVKTQPQVTMQSTKQALKRSDQVARQTAQTTKVAVKATTRMAVKMARAMVAMAKSMISMIVAIGGGAVLLIVLIMIIIVAAIASSPFGIFILEETNEGIPISAIVAECNQEFTQKIEKIETSNIYDYVEIQGLQADWTHILAVFAVKTAGTDDDTAQDVVIIDETKKNLLKEVFWDMNSISSHIEQENEENILYIIIAGKTSDDMISEYHFTQRQQEALATLLENSAVLLSATQNLTIIDGDAIDVLSNLPQTLSTERKAVVKAACSLVGKDTT